jgi:structural maintenance of chromosome 1
VLFTPDQQAQFDAARQEGERESAEKMFRARELEAQIRVIKADRVHVDLELREAQMRHDQLDLRAQSLQDAVAVATEQHQKDVQDCTDKRGMLAELSTWVELQDAELSDWTKERLKMQKEIQDITITEKQIEREKRLQQVSSDLQRVIPGVHGRVVELCKTSRKDLNKAIHMALGSYLDAIVVDSAAAGRQCVQYLKERMLEPMTFLPMASLNVQLDGRLREAVSQQDGMHMALSCITYDQDKHSRVFDFLLGTVVVADSLSAGRHFFFEELQKVGVNCRIVTMQGETISGDGNIAVNSNGNGRGATRFDFTMLDEKKRHLDEIEATICSIRAKSTAGHDGVTKAHEEILALEAKARESDVVLERHKADLQECQASRLLAREALDTKQPESARLEQAEQELHVQQSRLEEDIGQAVSQHFAALSQAMGVADIRQREREWRQERADAQRREGDLLQHEGSLTAELMLLEHSLGNQSHQSVAERLRELELQITELSAQHERLQQESEQMEDQAGGCEDHIAANKQEERNCDQAVLLCRQSLKEAQAQMSQFSKKVVEREADAHALQEKRQDILRQSVHDGVELPFSSEQDRDLARAALQQLAASSHSAGADVRAAADALDLSALDRERRKALEKGVVVQRLEEERYRADLKRMAVDLERLRPNLKAIEQLRVAVEEVEKSAQDTVEAQNDLKDVGDRFEACRAKRLELFMSCFRKVAAEIDQIYKKLTMNVAGLSASAEGGSAFLDLENLEEPFCAGVNFTAMPPAKRVSELGQLSGGEKAMAALAFLFAVHSYQRPPFLMLD